MTACPHMWPWAVVTRHELDEPSPWAGCRYLADTCPQCGEWTSTRPGVVADRLLAAIGEMATR